MSKKTTIKDVAKEAGVSIGTVDRVIHKRGRYSERTAEIVNAAIEKLNYTPSPIANALVSIKNHIKIGVSYPSEWNSELFWQEVNLGIKKAQQELVPFGIEIIIDCPTSFSSVALKSSIKQLINQDISALVTTAFNSNDAEESFQNFIPSTLPYATAINGAWKSDALFHIGANNEASGALIAKIISLYCGTNANIAIISPNMEVEDAQRRIKGFVNKVVHELPNMNVLQISPVFAKTTTDANHDIYIQTKKLIAQYPHLDAIYITNGFIKASADAITDISSSVKLFGHEYFQELSSYLNDGTICATVYQNPANQWYEAIMTMANYLRTQKEPEHNLTIGCSLITKETLPLLNLNII